MLDLGRLCLRMFRGAPQDAATSGRRRLHGTRAIQLGAVAGIALASAGVQAARGDDNLGIMPVAAQAGVDAGASMVVGYRRLTETEYRNSVSDIFGEDIVVSGRFEPEMRIGGLLASSTSILSITPAGYQGYFQIANQIADQVVSEERRSKLPCAPQSADAPDSECASLILGTFGSKAFRRPMEADDLADRVQLASDIAAQSGDFYAGLRHGIASLLISPQFLFRTELAVPAGPDSYTLDPYSRATQLSYLLWNTTPDEELLAKAASGELGTQAGLRQQVDRMMASPRVEDGVRAFFTDLLAPDYFGTINKDPSVYPAWSAELYNFAREETLRTILDIAMRDGGDLRDILTTRKTFLNRQLAAAYDVPFSFEDTWAEHTFPEGSERSGILTQLSVLAMFSHPSRSSPTERGKAIADVFLCTATPPPPPDVDFSGIDDLDNASLKTVRQRLEAHAEVPGCKACHQRMDPIGLALERFDAGGRFRTLDNGEVIDASSEMFGKSFDGARGLGEFLYDDPRFRTCMVRKAYAYGRGVNVYDTRPRHVHSVLDAFSSSEYQFKELLRALASSPEFYAVEPVEATDPTEPRTVALNQRG